MNKRLSLTELQLIIRDSLYMALPDMYWVIAEISEIKVNYSGHCYLELVEKQPDNVNISARIRGVIWNHQYRFLKPFFENSAGESLREGLKILFRAKIEYHEVYGLSLVINDIDPAFTLGEMALKRQQILKRLEREGVLTMNKDLDFPHVPQRIAVISSSNAAGYSDFITHLRENSYGYVFYTALFDTPMQGSDTQAGIVRSLDRIALHAELFDVVVIIRGGGSQTDLSWFDNYDIAYYITQFPVPVLTGIGHEKDLSVTDIVAWQALKTPTAVADFLIECMVRAEDQLNDMSRGITDMSLLILERNKNLIDSARLKLIPLAKMSVSEFRSELSDIIINMINTGKEYLMNARLAPENQRSRLVSGSASFLSASKNAVNQAKKSLSAGSEIFLSMRKNEIAGFVNMLKILDPDNVLKRGYTITSKNGRIIKSGRELSKDDIIDTRFSDGPVRSKVV
ncbi:MAG TPA: exodeoxyribonuclease VII large subunit [Bacteroidales bacterium]|jgi:exodeoxyribonuclease VII large subunit|nr:exodeoxyribonuclease VII large subunit [Bacteroidales bacterium]